MERNYSGYDQDKIGFMTTDNFVTPPFDPNKFVSEDGNAVEKTQSQNKPNAKKKGKKKNKK